MTALARARPARPRLLASFASAYGLARSLRLYWGSRRQLRAMRAHYAPFVPKGGLCFDIGAHAGNRSWVFAGLGARVVAAEPQPLFARFLRLLFRLRPAVTVLPVAVGAVAGRTRLLVSRATPTVTSASRGFLDAVATVPSFAWVRWDEEVAVEVVTLDALTARFGRPDFVKIDVEGMEPEVLMGLGHAVPALSFEIIPAHQDAARRCLARLAELGRYRFNLSIGESMRFAAPLWLSEAELLERLDAMPAHGPSGDVYALLDLAA